MLDDQDYGKKEYRGQDQTDDQHRNAQRRQDPQHALEDSLHAFALVLASLPLSITLT